MTDIVTIPDILMNALGEHLGYLRDRWQEEKEYEEFDDYVLSVKNNTPPGFEFVSLTRRFEATFTRDGKRYVMKANGRSVTLDVWSK
jgi:hypothetical protein